MLAIDFGTSNSLVAVADPSGASQPLPLDEDAGDPTVFRSILYFPHGQLCYYGQRAIREYSENQAHGRLIRSVKKYLPSENYIGSWIDDRMVRLEDLIGIFLLELRKRAQAHLGHELKSVLLGRPAKFSPDPIKDKLAEHRMRKAAEFAGFENVRFLPEPLAAAFELRSRLKETKNVLVVDLGGGTSDFTVIRIGPEAFKESDVLAMGGISLAGDVVDGDFMRVKVAPFLGSKVRYKVPLGRNVLEMPKSLLDHICSPADITQMQRSDYYHFFKQVQEWAPAAKDKESLQRLFTIVEDRLGFDVFEEIDRSKRQLSQEESAAFGFDYPDAEIKFETSAGEFDQLAGDTSDRILAVLDETLKDSGLKPADVDIVYCTGGTSRLKIIQKGLAARFAPERIVGVNFFHSVIEGLAARATELAKKEIS